MGRLTKLFEEENQKYVCIDVCGEKCVEDYSVCPDCEPFTNVLKKLAHYEDLEEQGLLIKLPESDWNDLIKQLTTIIANDFIVFYDAREFIVNQIFLLEYDEDFRFSATCRCFNGSENDWCYDEDCKYGEDGDYKHCFINFTYLDIGKTVFLTKEEAEEACGRRWSDDFK